MAGLNDPNFQAAMKINYLDPLNDLVVRRHVLLNRLDKNTKDVSGRHAYIPLISHRNPAVGSRKDTAAGATTIGPLFPEAGRQTYTSATYAMGMHYGRGSVSGPAQRKSRNDAGAFAQALDVEMQGLMKSLPDDLNRQICSMGNGRAASLSALGMTTATAQATSTLIYCQALDNFGVKVGDRVSFADITAGTGIVPTNGATVVGITLNTSDNGVANQHAVELSVASGASLTTADDAMYFGAGTSMTAESNSQSNEILGIRSIVDDGAIGADEQVVTEAFETHSGATSIGGITRSAANAFWQSKVMKTSGTKRTITQNLLFQAHLQSTAMNGASPNQIELYSSVATWGTVGMIQVGARVYNDTVDTVDMGFQFINIMGSKFFYDRDLHDGEIFYLSMEHIFLLTQTGYEFWDADGSVLRIAAGGNRDAMDFVLLRDIQLASNNLRTHTILGDLKNSMVIETTIH